MAKINYLNNKDLLREIHKSKNSFCSFIDKSHSEYDFIVQNKTEIDQLLITQIIKEKTTKMKIPEDSLQSDLIVVRVMTNEHIPDDTINGKRNKGKAKTNFPPFKHFCLKGNELVEVGRSHWKGDIETGHFSTAHGKIGAELAKMYIKLVERYGSKSNWRGYTYLDEMKGQALMHLSQVGLKFDESRSSVPNPFAYYSTLLENSFRRIVNLEKRNQNMRDDLLTMAGMTPSYNRQIDSEIAQKIENLTDKTP